MMKFEKVHLFLRSEELVTDMVVFPKAKINIGLRIVEKRPDGFHNIETFFYPVELADALEFVVRKDNRRNDTLRVTGVDG